MLDFEYFLTQHSIEFVTSGPNVAYGHINIRCPFCGVSDPSHHMGINLETGAWGCWRDASHRGFRPHRLVKAVLQCSWAKVEELCGTLQAPDRSGLGEVLDQLSQPRHTTTTSSNTSYTLPSELKPMMPKKYQTHRLAWVYLKQRGLTPTMVAERDVHFAVYGKWACRVVFPIRTVGGTLRSWVGRTVSDGLPRYLTPFQDEAENIKQCVYGEDLIAKGGRVLVICEGVFDAIRLDWVGRPFGIRATCIFGSEPTDTQRYALIEIARRYECVVAAMDPDNMVGTFRTTWGLSAIAATPSVLRGNFDFGAMSNADLQAWCLRFLKNSV